MSIYYSAAINGKSSIVSEWLNKKKKKKDGKEKNLLTIL